MLVFSHRAAQDCPISLCANRKLIWLIGKVSKTRSFRIGLWCINDPLHRPMKDGSFKCN